MIKSIEGNFVNFDRSFYGRVELDSKTGLIEKIAEPLGEADLVVENGLIFPGFVDLHVHAREDPSKKQTYKEDFQTASKAALHGGVVCALDMPNNPEPPVDEKTYLAKKKLAEGKPVDFVLYAGVKPGSTPLSLHVPYKVFMAHSVGDLFFKNFDQLEKTLSLYRGQAVSFHCEDPELISKTKRPPEAEISAIGFALFLIQRYELQGNICHCSTKAGIEKIKEAKRKGVRVTCEVTPHHLYFDETLLDNKNRKWLRVNPPIRTATDRKALLDALREGTIDYLASDHAPHTKHEKDDNQLAGETGSAGMPHLDTYGNVVTWLMAEQDFSAKDIARVCAYNPGQFVNQFTQTKYGKITEGYAGSFTVIDPKRPMVVLEKDLQTKCGWSPFSGVEFPGQVLYTVQKGEIAYESNASRSSSKAAGREGAA